MLAIGIDPGKHTGLAMWDTETQAFIRIDTMPVHQVIQREQVKGLNSFTLWPSHREKASSQESVHPERSTMNTTTRVRKIRSVQGFIVRKIQL